MRFGESVLTGLVLGTGLAGCAPAAGTSDPADFKPDYLGVETRLLDDDLINIFVEMKGARNSDDIVAYAQCAAAQYTLIQGYGFARHLRTNLDEEAGVWRADAVYTISPVLPRGVRTIDAQAQVESCTTNGIPTV